jgi:hypothetical protein
MTLPIDPASIGFPDEETMSEDQGLVENHEYTDLRGFWTLDDWPRLVQEEQELLDLIESGQNVDDDDLFDRFCDYDFYRMSIDPGVATTVAALVILGACPVSACSGGTGHYETHPLVYFWASEEQTKLISEVAKTSEVTLSGVSKPGLLLWTELDLDLMRSFAKNLVSIVESTRKGA